MANPIYSSVKLLCKYLGIYKTVPNKDSTANENIGTGDNSTSTFWLDQIGIITPTYTIYGGNSSGGVLTALVETTHYTLDLDTSKLELTSSGITTVNTSTLWGKYDYNSNELLSNELNDLLLVAETKLELYTEQRFADGTATDPNYREISNEQIKGHYRPEDKVYDLFFMPMVALSTTTDGAYTTGITTIQLTSATGFPSTGTIYIGGNKVAYTAKSGDVLTISTATPSIATGATVRGEVIELSSEPEGNALSYSVLVPDTDYQVDYLHGRVAILRNAFWSEISAEDRIYPSNYWIRASYFHAWHEKNITPTIPSEIQEIVNFFAAQDLFKRTVSKSYMTGLNDFNPKKMQISEDDIMERLDQYRPLHVGMSPYNKQFIS